jgi:carboxymethylenebutenolidase
MIAEEDLRIQTADGVAEAVLYRHDTPMPGVLHLTDIVGIRTSHREMARRLAAEGYTVLLPNIFFRSGRPPMFEFKPNFAGDERTMARLRELSRPLTAEAMERDGSTYVSFLAAQPSVREGMMGIVGYCIAGRMALLTAAARPDRVGLAVSFHGGSLVTDKPDSPHLALPRVRARLYLGHAVNDRSMTAEAIEAFDAALDAWGGHYESEVYDRALHGWTVPDSAAYNDKQAERAFAKLTESLKATLT